MPTTVYLGLRTKGYDPANNPHTLIVNEGDPLHLGKSGIELAMAQKYDILKAEGERGKWRVSTREYIYSLRDQEGEVVAFRFHPDIVPFCHLHLRRAHGDYAKAHYPTGRVSIEEVVALVIREFGVPPSRSDYREVLQRGFDNFAAWRTWHTAGIF